MKTFVALAISALSLVSLQTQAAPVTYNLVLTGTGGTAGNGSGSFTIDASQLGVGATSFTPTDNSHKLQAFSFTLGGATFDLTDTIGGLSVSFLGVNFTSLGATIIDKTTGAIFQYGGGTYVFTSTTQSFGTVAATLAPPTAVPEPLTLGLLAAGLIGIGAATRRKRRA